MKLNLKQVNAGTVTRTVLLLLAIANQILELTGRSVLPINDEQLTELIATVFTVITALAAWWKNNSFTRDAQTADLILKNQKAAEKAQLVADSQKAQAEASAQLNADIKAQAEDTDEVFG